MLVRWTNEDPNVIGFLGHMLWDNNPRSAQEQLDAAYAHGGGFRPFNGFRLKHWGEEGRAELVYPEDPPMRELSRCKLRDETIIMFDYAWVAVVQPDGSFVVSRMD
jgi:hypothetical protein